MTEFVWVRKEVVLALHHEQLTEHGGLKGIRDEGMFESALARPQNLVAYEKCSDAAKLAAAYACGILKNHPFTDGNKRTAFVTAELFLELNGFELTATDNDCLLTILSAADGMLSEEELIEWFQGNIKML
ncbi:death-on-curing protein [Candidatus Nitromaritima sp. SCGC AAA799-A02]|nr:death-on-curing protein [Candidatus Nitromaritima sp. SCGC AAA799-A02]